jgi:hypothetical protein
MIPQRTRQTTLPPPLPARMPRATGTIPPPIPQRASRAALPVGTPSPDVDIEIDIEIDVAADVPPPRILVRDVASDVVAAAPQRRVMPRAELDNMVRDLFAPPPELLMELDVPTAPPQVDVPRVAVEPAIIERSAVLSPEPDRVFVAPQRLARVMPTAEHDIVERDLFAPVPQRELERDLFAPVPQHDDRDLFAPVPERDLAMPVDDSADFERPARSFPIFKLGIAAVIVSGVSAMITLKVIGSGELPSSSGERVVSMQASPAVEPTAIAPMAPVIEPIATPPAVEPIAAPPAVEPIAAPPAAEPITVPPAAEPIAPPSAEPVAPSTPKRERRARHHRVAHEEAATTATSKPSSSGREGTLMVSTKPPCEIAIDGVATMLTTPQRSIKLRAGKHKVTLFNDSLDIKATFEIVINPSKPTKLLRDFMPK